ncbi:MAG: hypothetical protein ACK2UB_04835 [Anaerolineales bacterium]
MSLPRRSIVFRILVLAIPAALLSCGTFTKSAEGSPEAQYSPTRTLAGGGSAQTEDVSSGTAETPAETEAPTPTYTVVHTATPPGSAITTRFISDLDTKPFADQKKTTGGDEYHSNRYERPFTSEEMEYLSDVDLTRVVMALVDPWIYLTFEFAEPRAEGIGHTLYGAEFDLNKDGRGEYLVWGVSPPDGEWTTDGVEIWQDTNLDVGGPNPQLADAPWDEGDGYDENLFDSGQGADPDMAWIRQIEGGDKVQLAFKFSVLNNTGSFLWNGLADAGVQDPAWLDYNDHFEQEDAGSPLPVQTALYPVKDLWGIDNTCRDAFGYTPTGNEPGLCLYTGTISGTVFRDRAPGNPPSTIGNGILDANEPGVGVGTVSLGQGACFSTGYADTSPDGAGNYSFTAVPIGTYCVYYQIPSGYLLSSGSVVTVNLVPNGHKVVNFGIDWEESPTLEVPGPLN